MENPNPSSRSRRGQSNHSGSKSNRSSHKKRSSGGRGGGRGITADAEKEAQLLPIEWRCQTPPEQHQEVLDAVARSRRALDSADRVAKSIQLKQQEFFGGEEKERDANRSKELDNSMQFSPTNSSRQNNIFSGNNSNVKRSNSDSSDASKSAFFGEGNGMLPPANQSLLPKRAQSYQGSSTNMAAPLVMAATTRLWAQAIGHSALP